MWGKSLDGVCRLLSAAMVVCLALMVVMVFGNVVLRYGFNSGLTLSEELSRWLFVWMTFLGALVALRSHQHLGTDTLVSRLPRVGKKLCLGASHLLMLGLCALMLRGSWQQMRINWETTSAVMEVSMAWFYAAGVFFAALALVFVATEFLMLVTGRLAEAQLVGVTDSEDAPHGAPAQPAR